MNTWEFVEGQKCRLCHQEALWHFSYVDGYDVVKCRACKSSWEGPRPGDGLYASGCRKYLLRECALKTRQDFRPKSQKNDCFSTQIEKHGYYGV